MLVRASDIVERTDDLVSSLYFSELDANHHIDVSLNVLALTRGRFGQPPVQLLVDLNGYRHQSSSISRPKISKLRIRGYYGTP
jgi:hypothetical protein